MTTMMPSTAGEGTTNLANPAYPSLKIACAVASTGFCDVP